MYDLIIIGGGLTGSAVAHEHVAKGSKILVIDAGKKRNFDISENKKKAYYHQNLNEKFKSTKPYYFEGELTKALNEDHIAKNTTFLRSNLSGGLTNFWTAGSYTLNDQELMKCGLPNLTEMRSFYEYSAKLLGISYEEDDLSSIYPPLKNHEKPTQLNQLNKQILETYQSKKSTLPFILGRSRSATLTSDRTSEKRLACNYCNECFWGCSRRSIFNASIMLENLEKKIDLCYQSKVTSIDKCRDGKEFQVTYLKDGIESNITGKKICIAAGGNNSIELILKYKKIKRYEYQILDNDMIGVPCIFYGGRIEKEKSAYQFHQIAGNLFEDNIHFQITGSTNIQENIVAKELPGTQYINNWLVSKMKSNLLYIYFFNSSENSRKLNVEYSNGKSTRKLVETENFEFFKNKIRININTFKGIKIFPVFSKASMGDFGTSVHYGVKGIEDLVNYNNGEIDKNLFVVDGTLFKSIPSKNYSFTLFTNAIRIAKLHL